MLVIVGYFLLMWFIIFNVNVVFIIVSCCLWLILVNLIVLYMFCFCKILLNDLLLMSLIFLCLMYFNKDFIGILLGDSIW